MENVLGKWLSWIQAQNTGQDEKWVLILETCTLTVSFFPGRRSYKCPYCERVFIRANSELQKHIWIHEGVKPFKCSLCSYACRSKNNLQAHMLRHSSHKVGAGVSLCVLDPFACHPPPAFFCLDCTRCNFVRVYHGFTALCFPVPSLSGRLTGGVLFSLCVCCSRLPARSVGRPTSPRQLCDGMSAHTRLEISSSVTS